MTVIDNGKFVQGLYKLPILECSSGNPIWNKEHLGKSTHMFMDKNQCPNVQLFFHK